jgi:hypothetical protein
MLALSQASGIRLEKKMEYPEEVLTTSKRGKVEVRSLIDKGDFAQYEYLDPKTGKPTENKSKIILAGGTRREFFAVPMAGGRMLLIPAKPKGEKVGIYNRDKIVRI